MDGGTQLGYTFNVLQGQHRISGEPDVVFTAVLGSCISVCLHDPEKGIGGMNHFLLPGKGAQDEECERYGTRAMELLIDGLIHAGATRSDLTAKVFGGSSMMKGFDNIGKSNGVFAIKFLYEAGIFCGFSSLGGTLARKIKFYPATGLVRQFLVPNAAMLNDELPSTISTSNAPNDTTSF